MTSLNLVTVVEPPVEPVGVEKVHELLRLDAFGSPPQHPLDPMIRNMIRTSREWVENYTKRALVRQTVMLVLPKFPRYRVRMGSAWEDEYESRSGGFELPRPPYLSMISIVYYDENNLLQTLPSSSYIVSDGAMIPEVRAAEPQDWPFTYARRDAVRATYEVGYPPVGSPDESADLVLSIPESIKQAILIGVQLQYDDMTPETRTAMENLRVSLLGSYRVYSF